MGSPSFGVPGTSNNAPLPIPGNTNPTGTNNGVGFGGASFPNYPVFGAPSTGVVSPSANNPVFSGTSGGLASLSSGTTLPVGTDPNNPLWQQLSNSLGKSYGSGAGDLIYQMLTTGMFNPQVAASFLNAMQPGINQGEASITNAFGDEGSRFGSAAALGLGNYQSQVNLNEQSTLAGLYENAQSEQLSLLESVLPTLHAEKANKGGWKDDLIGGLEIAGSIAADVATAGAAVPLTAGITAMGIGTLTQGLNGGPQAGVTPSSTPIFGTGINNGYGPGNTGTFGLNAPSATGSNLPSWIYADQSEQIMDESNAGGALGGNNPFSGDVPLGPNGDPLLY